jgi:hypothetical protein
MLKWWIVSKSITVQEFRVVVLGGVLILAPSTLVSFSCLVKKSDRAHKGPNTLTL